MLDKLKKKLKIKSEIMKHGVYIDIKTKKLRQDVDFILYNLPKELVKGIELIEIIFDTYAEPHQITVKQTMNVMDIKREIGRYVYREKRWVKQEEVARKLLAQEKIDLDVFNNVCNTSNYLELFERINADVFAVYYGNDSMTIDEIGIAINSLYIKDFTEKNFSKQYNLDSFVDSLFEAEKKK